MRVREIISRLTPEQRKSLRKLLPAALVKCPVYETQKYPSMIVTVLGYDGMGELAGALLNLSSLDITQENLRKLLEHNYVNSFDVQRILKSKTTQPFLDILKLVRSQIEAFGLELESEKELSHGEVEGHPDLYHSSHLFEIKCTGKHKKNWTDFLFQVFAYAALSSVKKISLVLPLQTSIWTVDVTGWKKKKEYLEALEACINQAPSIDGIIKGRLLVSTAPIGHHTSRHSLCKEPEGRPYQIYLSSPQSTQFNLASAEISAIKSRVQRGLKFFIHVPHTLNLSGIIDEGDDWISECLQRQVKCGVELGASGVVVHVGKSTTQSVAEAISKMRSRILKTLDYATESCPILLETPAGQGTELLTVAQDFLDFMMWFDDPRIRMCLDTCHVYSADIEPEEYLQKATELDPDLVRLVHYNDSQVPKGSRVDRHAFIGTGHLGFDKLFRVAEICLDNNYPMVIE